MRVFTSWLIANLEIASIFILLPFMWCALKAYPEALENASMFVKLFVCSAGAIMLGGTPSKSFFMDLVNLLLTVCGVFAILSMGLENFLPNHAITIGVVAFIPSVMVAVFTARNFYDVISLRAIYSSSNASLFEVNALYTFSRFCVAFHLFAYIASILMIMWV